MAKYYLDDEELGRIFISVNARAKRFVFRTKPDGIHATVPPGTSKAGLERAIDSLRPKLTASKEEVSKPPVIDLNFGIDAEFFRVEMVQGERSNFSSSSERGKITIVCPPGARFDDAGVQEWLNDVIVDSMRRNAKVILSARLFDLAHKHGFKFRDVKINSSRGRWGSCSAVGNINLSLYLMLLPAHLIDYVLLHELCHTIEMNHSDKFWALLDGVTDGKSAALRAELKAVKPQI